MKRSFGFYLNQLYLDLRDKMFGLTVVEKPTEEVADEALSLDKSKVEAENNQDEEPSGSNDDDIEAAPKKSFNSHMFGYSWNGMEMDW